MITKHNFIVKEKDHKKRVDLIVVSNYSNYSRSKINKIIKSSLLTVNNKVINDPSKKLIRGDKVNFENIIKDTKIKPSKIPINIVHEDNDLIIVDKPAGMVVHPGAGNYTNTLVNGLLYYYKNNLSQISGSDRPGIVHRIDKDTSGLIVIAKNDNTHKFLAKQFEKHTISRSYLVFVYGIIKPLKGNINTLIGRSKINRQKMTANIQKGKNAITNYETISIYQGKKIPDISLLKCVLETGRTHQIRVHLNYKKNYIIGDQTYGKKIKKFNEVDKSLINYLKEFKRQALHANTLGFVHPKNNEFVSFTSKLPKDLLKLQKMLEKLRN